MTQQLFIPETIRVGYQERKDTYTGKLAYVIYFDAKGKLRKEASWTSWCHLKDEYSYIWKDGERTQSETPTRKGIPFNDFENVPTEGFVLNKKVGDYKSDWNHRMAHVRVFDPRGFEFEISVENLLFILAEGDCTRGKGLEGKFVYSWDGTELVLLPTHCNDYQNCAKFTKLQGKKLSLKDIVAGNTYTMKDQSEYVYVGRLAKGSVINEKPKRVHVLYSQNSDQFSEMKSGANLAECKSNECYPGLAELIERYDIHHGNIAIASARLVEGDKIEDRYSSSRTSQYCEYKGDIYKFIVVEYDCRYSNSLVENFDPTKHLVKLVDKYSIKNGVLVRSNCKVILWPTVFKSPELKENPDYDPSKANRWGVYNSYSYRRYTERYLRDTYEHTDYHKEIADVSLGHRRIIVTTTDGREFITDSYRYHQYEG